MADTNFQNHPQEDDQQGCTRTVSGKVCVEAVITVMPIVVATTPEVKCIGKPSKHSCEKRGFTPSPTGSCNFSFSQILCINVPVTFEAQALPTIEKVACGHEFHDPDCKDCQHHHDSSSDSDCHECSN